MSETLGPIENHRDDQEVHEAETSSEAATPPETRRDQAEKHAEAVAKRNEEDRAKKQKLEQARKEAEEAHESAAKEPSRIGTTAIRGHLHKLEPVVDTVAKTWGAIRQNLSPSQKTFSKVIHNPVVSSVSEFTAKTLARPYAILSGGAFAVIGSTVYLYFTRHLGYTYNFFVPILLFLAGLAVGIIVELLYTLLAKPHKK